MLDQADNLRQLAHAAPPVVCARTDDVPMVVVTGAKPGVGATTVAMNLAAVLADRGQRVVLVDAALNGSDLFERAGIRSANAESLADLLAGKCKASAALAPGPAGMLILSNHRTTKADMDFSRQQQRRLLAELNSLRNDSDVIVVDTGSGMSPWSRRFWLRARLAILVTTIDDAAIIDAYSALKLNARDGRDSNLRVLANQCDSNKRAAQVYRRLMSACDRFLGLKIASLPHLPRHAGDDSTKPGTTPRVWDEPNSPFGHGVLWVGRAVTDMLASRIACATAWGAPVTALSSQALLDVNRHGT